MVRCPRSAAPERQEEEEPVDAESMATIAGFSQRSPQMNLEGAIR